MRIRRDYSQPFFREPKRHRLRNTLIAAILGLLLGLSVVSQRATIELVIESLVGDPATPTPLPSELAMRAALKMQAGDFPAAGKHDGDCCAGAPAQYRLPLRVRQSPD